MEFIPCAPGQLSFFRLIDAVWLSHRPKHTIHRVCTLMRLMAAKTLVAEMITEGSPEWSRVQLDFAAIRLRLKKYTIELRADKFTFLTQEATSLKGLRNAPKSAFLGYCTIINISLGGEVYWSYVFESVVRELGTLDGDGVWAPHPNYFLHAKRTFLCHIGDSFEYELLGSYFCQQNSITHVCAHACAAMMLTNSPIGSEIITSESLNVILNYDHQHHRFGLDYSKLWNNPSDTRVDKLPYGLDLQQLNKVFDEKDYAPHSFEFYTKRQQQRFRSALYGFLESGFPALLTFSPRISSKNRPISHEHVIAVIGHTLNPHSWLPLPLQTALLNTSQDRPKAKKAGGLRRRRCLPLSSLSWVDDLIVHDETLGMQLWLPAHAFKPARHPDHHVNFTPRVGLGMFPKAYKIRLLGHDAERIAISVFMKLARKKDFLKGSYYTEHLLSKDGNVPTSSIVFRTLLVKWKTYVADFASSLKGDAQQCVDKISNHLSHVWLVEVTESDLLAGNHSKVIDIILDSTFEPYILSDTQISSRSDSEKAILLIRLPTGTYGRTKTERRLELLKDWPQETSQVRPIFKLVQL